MSCYWKYRLGNWRRLLQKKMKRFSLKKIKNYAGRPLLSAQTANDIIKTAVEQGEPFAAVRFGSSELATTVDAVNMDCGRAKDIRDKCMTSLCRNAGFFPNDKTLAYKYGKLQVQLVLYADLFAVWGMNMEDYIIDTFGKKDAKVCFPRGFEPYYYDNPWSAALKGKKVLIIHPFEQTIRRQYEKRELLFANPQILPEFELKTLKAVQSAAFNETPFETWFDALDYMYSEAMKIDFDVAIVGCGAYGLPLTCMLKKAGKIAIHMGGATQLLFGIKGNRWDNHPVISKLYNEHWVRPSDEETPKKADVVEGACYW